MKDKSPHSKFPYFTALLTFTTLTFFVIMAVLSKKTEIDYTLFEKFGAPYAIQIYHGQYWGVIVNSLIHAFPLHLIVNLIGLWVFGAFLERRIGWQRLFIFGLVSSIFTSLVQLSFTNDAGLGLSGVNYAMFGLIFVLALRKEKYVMKFHLPVILFMIAFIIFSISMNITSDWFMGVEAQISGLFWGVLIGFGSRIQSKWQQFAFQLIPFLIALSSMFYAPWSSMWQTAKGIELHELGNLKRAKIHYKKAIKIEPTNVIAKANLQQIQIARLAKLAYSRHKAKDFVAAHRFYLKILAIDKNNSWARNNMRELP